MHLLLRRKRLRHLVLRRKRLRSDSEKKEIKMAVDGRVSFFLKNQAPFPPYSSEAFAPKEQMPKAFAQKKQTPETLTLR